jgi:hypothetical protein
VFKRGKIAVVKVRFNIGVYPTFFQVGKDRFAVIKGFPVIFKDGPGRFEGSRGKDYRQVQAGIGTGFSSGAGVHQKNSIHAGSVIKESGEFLCRLLAINTWIGEYKWYYRPGYLIS